MCWVLTDLASVWACWALTDLGVGVLGSDAQERQAERLRLQDLVAVVALLEAWSVHVPVDAHVDQRDVLQRRGAAVTRSDAQLSQQARVKHNLSSTPEALLIQTNRPSTSSNSQLNAPPRDTHLVVRGDVSLNVSADTNAPRLSIDLEVISR